MKRFIKMILISSAATLLAACQNPAEDKAQDQFKYTIDAFADLKVMRYRIPGWENLTLRQKEYAYYLSEAAKYGETSSGTRTARTTFACAMPWKPFWWPRKSTPRLLSTKDSSYMPSA